MKLYLLIFSENNYNRKEITTFLSNSSDFDFWFFNLPNSIFIRSKLSATQIIKIIEEEFGRNKLFITEVVPNSSGIIPTKHVEFLKNSIAKNK